MIVKIIFCMLGVVFIIISSISCCSRESRIDRILKDLEKKELGKKLDDIIAISKKKERGGSSPLQGE